MTRRIRPRPEYAVPYWVDQLVNKFEYPEQRREAPFELGGGAGGAPTIVVAASDASDLSKSKADLICTGLNDHNTIMEAYEVLVQSTGPPHIIGGRMLLTEGVFNCHYGELVMTPAPVTVQGLGQNVTWINFDGGSAQGFAFAAGADTIRDLGIFGTGPGAAVRLTAGRGTRVDNVYFENSGPGVKIERTTDAAREVAITNCYFQNDGVGVDATPVSGMRGLIVVGNHFVETGDDAIRVTDSGGGGVVIANNHINVFFGFATRGISVDGCLGMTIFGNWINAAGIGIQLAGSIRDFTVAGNIIGTSFSHGIEAVGSGVVDGVIASNIIGGANNNGISLEDASRISVTGNNINRSGHHAIALDGVTDCSIADNVLRLASHQANTYDGVHLAGDSDRNYIHGNVIVPSPTVSPRYGINVSASTCDCNIVVGNQLGDPSDYGTDALNDAGTDTQLFYPADATYGDNFTDCTPTSPSSPTSP